MTKSIGSKKREESHIETGDIGEVKMPPMTARQFSEFAHKVERETVGMVISKLEEVLEDKTSPKLISAIIEDLKDALYD